MGRDDDDTYVVDFDDKPKHEVILDDFYIGQWLVTQDFWENIMIYNESENVGKRRPNNRTSWFEAIAFCNKLSDMDGIRCVYYTDNNFTKLYTVENVPIDIERITEADSVIYLDVTSEGYRLPTEAEWEYAALGGPYWNQNLLYPGGDQINPLVWYRKNEGKVTNEIGLLAPNQLGLYDMQGNVEEWCWDWFAKYPTDATNLINPKGPMKGRARVLRGGGAGYLEVGCRVKCRSKDIPESRSVHRGFRLVQSIMA